MTNALNNDVPRTQTGSTTRFIIYGSPRTGSNFLVGLLNKSPDIICHFEVFHEKNVFLATGVKPEDLVTRDMNPTGYLADTFARSTKPVTGLKIFPGHSPEVLKQTLTDGLIRKIVLYRENLLAQFASVLEARARGEYAHSQKRPAAQLESRPRFVASEFEKYCKYTSKYYAAILDALVQSRQPFLPIEYTQTSSVGVLSGLYTFLGARPSSDPAAGRRSLVKTGSNAIAERFGNPVDVHSYLQAIGRAGWSYEQPSLWPTNPATR
jgi:hypothetical protein